MTELSVGREDKENTIRKQNATKCKTTEASRSNIAREYRMWNEEE